MHSPRSKHLTGRSNPNLLQLLFYRSRARYPLAIDLNGLRLRALRDDVGRAYDGKHSCPRQSGANSALYLAGRRTADPPQCRYACKVLGITFGGTLHFNTGDVSPVISFMHCPSHVYRKDSRGKPAFPGTSFLQERISD